MRAYGVIYDIFPMEKCGFTDTRHMTFIESTCLKQFIWIKWYSL